MSRQRFQLRVAPKQSAHSTRSASRGAVVHSLPRRSPALPRPHHERVSRTLNPPALHYSGPPNTHLLQGFLSWSQAKSRFGVPSRTDLGLGPFRSLRGIATIQRRSCDPGIRIFARCCPHPRRQRLDFRTRGEGIQRHRATGAVGHVRAGATRSRTIKPQVRR